MANTLNFSNDRSRLCPRLPRKKLGPVRLLSQKARRSGNGELTLVLQRASRGAQMVLFAPLRKESAASFGWDSPESGGWDCPEMLRLLHSSSLALRMQPRSLGKTSLQVAYQIRGGSRRPRAVQPQLSPRQKRNCPSRVIHRQRGIGVI